MSVGALHTFSSNIVFTFFQLYHYVHFIQKNIIKQKLEIAASHQSHCVKSVRIRSYSGPHFPAFGLNISEYGHFLRSVMD